MWIALGHTLVCSLIGAVLTAVAAVIWQLQARGGDLDAVALVALTGLGALVSGVVGGMLALMYQARLRRLEARLPVAVPPLPTSAVLAPAAAQRRKRPMAGRISADFRWEALSATACQLLRRRTRALRGRPIYDALHPEDYGVVDRALGRAQATGRPQTVTCRFLVPVDMPAGAFARTTFRSDTDLLPPLDPATFRHVRLRIRARLEDGVAHYTCRFADLSPRVELQQELHRARATADAEHRRYRRINADLNRLKESYRELYQNAPVMYFRLDVDGRLIAFNDTLIRTLGYQRGELDRHSYADLLVPVAGGSAPEPRGRAPFEEGEINTRWRTKNGNILDVWIRTVADRDDRGEMVRFRSAALDLTEKYQLAHELRARGDELEQTNQRLRAINTELDNFTHVVSHDLREPLRTLQTYAKLLHDECSAQLGTDGFQYIDHLIKASRRLGLLIEDLLDLSQAGRITRALQAFDLIDAVKIAKQDLVDMIQRKEATVLTEPNLPQVVGDPKRITQLLTNLIANGLKYNQSARPEVVIAARNHRDGGNGPCVLVSVRDNGIGIDPQFQDQIFGIFRRLRADEYEGTGAGLAICRRIVEAHHGRIWVESQPGAGATFYFTLPDIAAPAAPTTPRDQAAKRSGVLPRPVEAAPPAEPPRPRANRRPAPAADRPQIVLVEDDPEQAHLIQRLSGEAEFLWYSTAERAWDHLQGQEPDLLLLDINLGGMSGVELCRRVRTLPALRETPVVLFVSDPTPERLAELRAAGADFFLSKDLLVDPPEWRRRLQEVLDRVRAPAKVVS
jgi:PAS domain S-box-containing protein